MYGPKTFIFLRLCWQLLLDDTRAQVFFAMFLCCNQVLAPETIATRPHLLSNEVSKMEHTDEFKFGICTTFRVCRVFDRSNGIRCVELRFVLNFRGAFSVKPIGLCSVPSRKSDTKPQRNTRKYGNVLAIHFALKFVYARKHNRQICGRLSFAGILDTKSI